MSREAFGDPPESQEPPQVCPVCGGEWHAEDCEFGKEVARRLKAERDAHRLAFENDQLRREAERLQKLLTAMSMTQRYAGMLRRQAGNWDQQGMPVQAECARQAARHMEELQAAKDAIARPWQPMKTAPKDGTTVLVLLESSDVPKAVEWCEADHFLATDGAGWYMPWDGTKIQPHDGPRYWMHCPDDPDDSGEPEDA